MLDTTARKTLACAPVATSGFTVSNALAPSKVFSLGRSQVGLDRAKAGMAQDGYPNHAPTYLSQPLPRMQRGGGAARRAFPPVIVGLGISTRRPRRHGLPQA
jgi:hypothetical protein